MNSLCSVQLRALVGIGGQRFCFWEMKLSTLIQKLKKKKRKKQWTGNPMNTGMLLGIFLPRQTKP